MHKRDLQFKDITKLKNREPYFADQEKYPGEINLKNNFPNKSFTIRIDDKEFGDLLVTFFQI